MEASCTPVTTTDLPPLSDKSFPYPSGTYIESFDEFAALCSEGNIHQFIFEKTQTEPRLSRESRGSDTIIASVPFGKQVTLTNTPLSDSPSKRFFIDVLTDTNRVNVLGLRKYILKLEMNNTEADKEMFNNLRWYIDTNEQTLNWTITHVYNPEKKCLRFNSPINGFRIYLIQ